MISYNYVFHCITNKQIEISYLVVTINVQEVVESSTVWAVLKAEGRHPSICTVPTLSLDCNHCAHVQKLNLHKVVKCEA